MIRFPHPNNRKICEQFQFNVQFNSNSCYFFQVLNNIRYVKKPGDRVHLDSIPDSHPLGITSQNIWHPTSGLHNSLSLASSRPFFHNPVETITNKFQVPSNPSTTMFLTVDLAYGCTGILEVPQNCSKNSIPKCVLYLTPQMLFDFDTIFFSNTPGLVPSQKLGSYQESKLKSYFILCHAWSPDSRVLFIATHQWLFAFIFCEQIFHLVWKSSLFTSPVTMDCALGHIPFQRSTGRLNYSQTHGAVTTWRYRIALSNKVGAEMIYLCVGRFPFNCMPSKAIENPLQFDFTELHFSPPSSATSIPSDSVYFAVPLGRWYAPVASGTTSCAFSPSGDFLALGTCQYVSLYWGYPQSPHYALDKNLSNIVIGDPRSPDILWQKNPMPFPCMSLYRPKTNSFFSLGLSKSSIGFWSSPFTTINEHRLDKKPLHDSTVISSGSEELSPSTFRYRTLNSCILTHLVPSIKYITDICWGPKGNFLFVCGWNGQVSIFNQITKSLFHSKFPGRTDPVFGVWHPFSPSSGIVSLGLPNPYYNPGCMAYCMDHRTIAVSIPSEKSLFLLDIQSGRRIAEFLSILDFDDSEMIDKGDCLTPEDQERRLEYHAKLLRQYPSIYGVSHFLSRRYGSTLCWYSTTGFVVVQLGSLKFGRDEIIEFVS